ncbi:DeoR/GlpR family DNA-binding transcription regulator [Amycolatopsis cihanbeyliensis]|uniref:Lactose phosphotransferase system repressor n=1 Tax=Amycolatopsis cihanbeyliensis TaxID=1128664 RepID=A0A542CS62_AMYCI|nr:DeoR/GlpR family DNA-binding transcription regulator [Amycolatopsis cihanbeyliensis]TQI93666.1 DeoR family transcriptional regulator [Amycolatopsis cihanbeyliensis]
MYAEERQQVILERARAHGRVDVTALADEFTVTTETIRRDLTILERHGVLRRVHGGAIPVERLGFEPALATREGVMMTEKVRIAKAALAELPAEGSILLDAGSTTARLADELPTDRELTVVTHSVNIALSLAARPNLTLMLVGGRLRSRTLATVDSWALQALDATFVDVAFIATNGISAERGLTTPDAAEAMIKRAAIASSRRCVLLADHTKVGNDCFTRFAELKDIDTFITDDDVDPATLEEIANAGPRTVTV